MLSVELDEGKGIALLEPDGPLSQGDFEAAAKLIDPHIEKTGQLNGLVIHTQAFPGWDSFAGLSSHLKFVKEHHKKISRIAIATDSVIGRLGESIASHFMNAEIKEFSFQELEQAKAWAAGV
jgi:hypothetical protein